METDAEAYEIEAELGLLGVVSTRAKKGSRTVFNGKIDVFPKTARGERWRSGCFEDLALRLSSIMPSYRRACGMLNRIRWQDDGDGIKLRTLSDYVVGEGNDIMGSIDKKAAEILAANGFCPAAGKPAGERFARGPAARPEYPEIPEDRINAAVDGYNEGKERSLRIDEAQIRGEFVADEHAVNISVDDVGSLEQKEAGRSRHSPPKESRSYVKNTVVHVQHGAGRYVLDGLGIHKTMAALTAFLLFNDLFDDKCLVFFTDGAIDIRNAIKGMFGWRAFSIILDWYHLKKKCQERLSMAMKGRKPRNEALEGVLALLWLGKVDEAVEYLKGIGSGKLKNDAEIERLAAYLDRNWSCIPCYALRKQLGLRVSSNRGEKANDLVVSKRQKHNGMSWSKPGSSGLANVSAMFLNKENENWINRREISFRLSYPDKAAA